MCFHYFQSLLRYSNPRLSHRLEWKDKGNLVLGPCPGADFVRSSVELEARALKELSFQFWGASHFPMKRLELSVSRLLHVPRMTHLRYPVIMAWLASCWLHCLYGRFWWHYSTFPFRRTISDTRSSLEVRSGQDRGWEGRAMKEGFLEAIIPELRGK